MKDPIYMTTTELIWWARHGGNYSEHVVREATARRILAARHGESYAVRMINMLCGGGSATTCEGTKV